MSPTQQMIQDAFDNKILVDNVVDVQSTPVYDTVAIGPGPATLSQLNQFFTNVGSASGKTYAQTNMSTSQILPAPQVFSIYAIRLQWNANVWRPDIETVLGQFALEFWLLDKCYSRAPLWYYNAGGGLWGFSHRSNATLYGNGVPDRNAMHKLAIPLVIYNQMRFFAQFVGNPFTPETAVNGGVGFNFTLLLDGLYGRQVQ